MTLKKGKVQNSIKLLRNLRIVSLKNAGWSIAKIADHFGISRQKASSIYLMYKDVPFYYEDDKVVIH
jgi:hypothetical protein